MIPLLLALGDAAVAVVEMVAAAVRYLDGLLLAWLCEPSAVVPDGALDPDEAAMLRRWQVAS